MLHSRKSLLYRRKHALALPDYLSNPARQCFGMRIALNVGCHSCSFLIQFSRYSSSVIQTFH
jgi:hypothetical protein